MLLTGVWLWPLSLTQGWSRVGHLGVHLDHPVIRKFRISRLGICVSFPSSFDPGIKPGSHALQEDSLLSESPGFGTLSWGKRRALIQSGLVWIYICHFLARNVILEKVFSLDLNSFIFEVERMLLSSFYQDQYITCYRWCMKNVFQKSLFSKSVHLGRQNI